MSAWSLTPAASWDPATVYRRRWATLGMMCLSLTLIGLDNSILNVAMPTLVNDLNASGSQLQWIVDSYTLIFAGLLLTAGTLGDRFGRRRALFVGMTIFGLSSMWAAWAGGANELIVARGLMGVGGAFIMPATLSIIINVFTDPVERGKAIGIWAAVAGLGIIGGPTLGGWMLLHFWWGSVFLINVPVATATVLLGPTLIPESADPNAPRADLVGMVTSMVGLAALVWGFIEAPLRGWGNPAIVASLVLGAATLVAFVRWERHTSAPMLDLRFFRDVRFSVCSLVISIASFALVGGLFFISQYLQFVLGFSSLRTGAGLLPFTTMAIGAPLGITLTQHYGPKFSIAAGLALTSMGLSVMATTSIADGYGRLGWALGLMGFGMGMAMAPATDAVMASLPPEKSGIGSAVNDTTRQIGGALGVAVLGSLMVSRFQDLMPHQVGFTPVPEEARRGIGQALAMGNQLGGLDGKQLTETAAASFEHAMGITVLVAGMMTLLGAVIAAVWLPMRGGARGRRPLSAGGPFPGLNLTSVAGTPVRVPDSAGQVVHVQMRRFAGCPASNLQLRPYVSRRDEIADAGVREVVVFHSGPAELRAFAADLPFDVVGDPQRRLYGGLGVRRSPLAVLAPGAWRLWPAALGHALRRGLAFRSSAIPLAPTGGTLGLPADFLIGPDGTLLAAHYGRHAYDQWSVDQLLTLAAHHRPARPLLIAL
jgi:EmrB/QacA subfamily drug resistance transporter